ncbi:MAG: aldo/keto reductase [Eubacterium sp.]|nr:aldo/keto reductase [Eubacterium sp.]
MIDRVEFKDGIEISRLGLGNMRLPVKTPLKREANPMIDYNKGQELVDIAYENGVNYYDTAYMYHAGKSEKFIGTALKKYPRDSFYLADKLPIWMCTSKKDMERIFNKQLTRCGVEYFDFYLLHALDGKAWDKCIKFDALSYLENKRSEGKIKYFGFSFHGEIDDLKRIVAAYKWDFAQIQLNYLDWKNYKSEEQYNILTDAGIPVIIMEPVRGGKLADPPKNVKELFDNFDNTKSYASWAIRFAATHSNVLTVLSGMNSKEQLLDNLSSLTDFKPLTETELKLCANAAALLNKNDVIPCTGCDYCADCPQEVKISSVFAAYNKFKNGEATEAEAKREYDAIDIKADSCIGCGACKTHCPQSIDIPELMQNKMKSFFE